MYHGVHIFDILLIVKHIYGMALITNDSTNLSVRILQPIGNFIWSCD